MLQRIITISILILILLFFFGFLIINDPTWYPLQITFYLMAKYLSKFKNRSSILYDDFFETPWRIFVAVLLLIGFALTFIIGLVGTIYEDIFLGGFILFFIYALVVFLIKRKKG